MPEIPILILGQGYSCTALNGFCCQLNFVILHFLPVSLFLGNHSHHITKAYKLLYQKAYRSPYKVGTKVRTSSDPIEYKFSSLFIPSDHASKGEAAWSPRNL